MTGGGHRERAQGRLYNVLNRKTSTLVYSYDGSSVDKHVHHSDPMYNSTANGQMTFGPAFIEFSPGLTPSQGIRGIAVVA